MYDPVDRGSSRHRVREHLLPLGEDQVGRDALLCDPAMSRYEGGAGLPRMLLSNQKADRVSKSPTEGRRTSGSSYLSLNTPETHTETEA